MASHMKGVLFILAVALVVTLTACAPRTGTVVPTPAPIATVNPVATIVPPAATVVPPAATERVPAPAATNAVQEEVEILPTATPIVE